MTRFRLFLIFILSGSAGTARLIPNFAYYDVSYRDERFSVAYLYPIDLETEVAKVASADRAGVRNTLRYNAYEAVHVWWAAARFLKNRYAETQLTHAGDHFIERAINRLAYGERVGVVVTNHLSPFHVQEVYGQGFDFGAGVPTEQRCVGRSRMERFARSPLRLGPTPLRYIPRTGSFREIPEVSRFLSRIPLVEGGDPIEGGTFGRGTFGWDLLGRKTFRIRNFAPLIQRVLLAHQAYIGRTPLPSELRPPPLVGELAEERARLLNLYPDLPKTLIYPETQEFAIADRYVFHAFKRALVRVYENYGATLLGTFEDPDKFTDPSGQERATSYLMTATRQASETTSMDAFARLADSDLVVSARVNLQTEFGPLDISTLGRCGSILGARGGLVLGSGEAERLAMKIAYGDSED